MLKQSLEASILETTPVEYVVTVPAVWSDRARTVMRTCSEAAGLGCRDTLHMVTEPEAAAVYALRKEEAQNLSIGDTFVLCDAGGGTVDLISYTVQALQPKLIVEEAAPGSGGCCGSSILNRIFQSFLRSRLGEHPQWHDEVSEEVGHYPSQLP